MSIYEHGIFRFEHQGKGRGSAAFGKTVANA